MTNTERIQANNANLRECIKTAENLPEVGASFPIYEGGYSVTSSVHGDITLPTAQKVLMQDIKINKIPYAVVSNNTGGQTATIG